MKRRFFKKAIAIGLAISSLFAMMSTTTVFADDSIKNISYDEVGKDNIPDKTLKFYTTGIDFTSSFVVFAGEKEGNLHTVKFADCVYTPKSLVLPEDDKYEVRLQSSYFGGGCSDVGEFPYSNLGGLYKKLKVKLSDISSYFNEDGTHTHEIFGNIHNYNFSEEEGYTSILMFKSGAAYTEVRPDSNGEAEIWVSRRIGEQTECNTNFGAEGVGIGGGRNGMPIRRLMCGNVDLDGSVDIKDATIIQHHIAEITELKGLSRFNADVNNDDVINIEDVTNIQKYLAMC